jgi:hypothetical protein
MNDTFVPAYGFMRPESWSTYWTMPSTPFGLPSSALSDNPETTRGRAYSITTDLSNALDASGPAWLHSVIAARTNGGILGSLARALRAGCTDSAEGLPDAAP